MIIVQVLNILTDLFLLVFNIFVLLFLFCCCSCCCFRYGNVHFWSRKHDNKVLGYTTMIDGKHI